MTCNHGLEDCALCHDKSGNLLTTEISESASTLGSTAKLIDWEANINSLNLDIRSGCCEASIGVMQYEIAGRRVELKLVLTDDETEFLL